MDAVHVRDESAQGNEIKHRPQIISASGPLVRNGDYLQLDASSTDASATIEIRGRLLRPDGQTSDFAGLMTITGTGQQSPIRIPLASGWILGFSVYVSAGTITDLEIQARVTLVLAVGPNFVPIMTLASGDITNTRSLGLNAYG
jgi:hypothetical protein